MQAARADKLIVPFNEVGNSVEFSSQTEISCTVWFALVLINNP